jgi:hypothetical protein
MIECIPMPMGPPEADQPGAENHMETYTELLYVEELDVIDATDYDELVRICFSGSPRLVCEPQSSPDTTIASQLCLVAMLEHVITLQVYDYMPDQQIYHLQP